MIKVRVVKSDDTIKEVSITGHACYEDFGKDIVCAAVSSIVTTTVNAILRIDEESILYDEKGFSLKVLKTDKIVNILLINMISLLEELEQSYPDNIKFI